MHIIDKSDNNSYSSKGENHSSQQETFEDKDGLVEDDDNATATTNTKKERIINFSFSKR